jgi:hypothetical protein
MFSEHDMINVGDACIGTLLKNFRHKPKDELHYKIVQEALKIHHHNE